MGFLLLGLQIYPGVMECFGMEGALQPIQWHPFHGQGQLPLSQAAPGPIQP